VAVVAAEELEVSVAKAVRTWRRIWWLAAVVGLLLVLYVGSYVYLSRRGMAEAAAAGWPYFFYCPMADVVPYQNLPRQHRLALDLFDPLNKLDRAWFGGGQPCHGITWGFGKP
jgi:hypothetical protein